MKKQNKKKLLKAQAQFLLEETLNRSHTQQFFQKFKKDFKVLGKLKANPFYVTIG